ncbi:hypothetical protein VB773_01770 [Haloarculaceae archaeon H-GB2-1]|nr:hypothetical protein [Haloarculaceae archaeon H-GB1-1]MEA5388397.1 hypothetical protein [Haloarculaceae archaeon H-GB11]MEA5406434.1 hypothetical protein [Haloarculaceae archaeon H-GB2-1]
MVSLPIRRELLGETVLVVVASTLVLTWSFVGLLGFVRGDVVGVSARLPLYVLVLAIAFVVAIFQLTQYEVDGKTALVGAVGVGLLSFLLALTAGEGVAFTARYPAQVFNPQLILYVVAAALITTGTGYWLLSYWRDLAAARAVGE